MEAIFLSTVVPEVPLLFHIATDWCATLDLQSGFRLVSDTQTFFLFVQDWGGIDTVQVKVCGSMTGPSKVVPVQSTAQDTSVADTTLAEDTSPKDAMPAEANRQRDVEMDVHA